MGILSVCLTVTTRYGFKPEIETPGLQSSPYDSLESLVSNEVILVPLDEEIPL